MLAVAMMLVVAPPLRVGAVFNLTGSFASTDGPGWRGMQLAAAELGRTIEVVPIDTRSDPKRAGSLVQAALRKGRFDALAGLYDSDYALPVGRTAQRARIPFVTSGATLPGLTERIGDYAFAACYGDDDQAAAMAHFARNHLGLRSCITLIDGRYAYTSKVGHSFHQAFSKEGGISCPMEAGSNGLTNGMSRTKPNEFEAYYGACLPDHAGMTVRQVRALGFSGPILSGDGFDTPLLTQEGGPDARGVFFTTHVAYDAPHAGVRKFVAAYRARYGVAPESAAAALGYDTLRLIADASRRRGKGTLRDAIAATKNLPGVTGTISYAPGTREPRKPITVVEIIDGKPAFRELIAPKD
ncbi:MAG: ABC transporter substrate-binding protein [Fimbriimonas sp.]